MLYIGYAFAGAFAETILAQSAALDGRGTDRASRSVTELAGRTALRMVAMHAEAGLQALGTDNSIHGPYEPCGAWADALWDHPEESDGIAYLSRHDPGEACCAIRAQPDHLRREIDAPLDGKCRARSRRCSTATASRFLRTCETTTINLYRRFL